MPTYYVEDYDGERNKDAVEPVELKVVSDTDVEDKAVKSSESKAKKKS